MSNEEIEKKIKNTVGYAETGNKGIFMDGANVGFSKAEDFYTAEIGKLKLELESYKWKYEIVLTDMKALNKIINTYSSED